MCSRNDLASSVSSCAVKACAKGKARSLTRSCTVGVGESNTNISSIVVAGSDEPPIKWNDMD